MIFLYVIAVNVRKVFWFFLFITDGLLPSHEGRLGGVWIFNINLQSNPPQTPPYEGRGLKEPTNYLIIATMTTYMKVSLSKKKGGDASETIIKSLKVILAFELSTYTPHAE